MIAVIFEVTPHANKKANYLDVAAEMRPLVDEIDGFLSVERFQSLTNPEKLLPLSHSFEMRRRSTSGVISQNTGVRKNWGVQGISRTTGCASPTS